MLWAALIMIFSSIRVSLSIFWLHRGVLQCGYLAELCSLRKLPNNKDVKRGVKQRYIYTYVANVRTQPNITAPLKQKEIETEKNLGK